MIGIGDFVRVRPNGPVRPHELIGVVVSSRHTRWDDRVTFLDLLTECGLEQIVCFGHDEYVVLWGRKHDEAASR